MATADRETTDREPESLRTPESPALPNARLNPLLNPLLAKQLGRWAHIYYTASVDKREAAVEKLVSELEAEEVRLNGAPRNNPPPETSPTATEPRAASASFTAPVVALKIADEDILSVDPRGDEPRRKAGVSGVALHGVSVPDFSRHDPLPHKQRPLAEIATSAPQASETPQAEAEHSRALRSETTPDSWHELLGDTRYVPEADRATEPYQNETRLTPESHSDDVPYPSRDAVAYSHAFDDILAQSEQIQMHQTPARSWRLPMIVAVVLGVFGGSLWLLQGGRLRAGVTGQVLKGNAPALQQSAPQTPAVHQDGAAPATAAVPPPSTLPPAAAAAANSTPSPQTATALHATDTPASGQPLIPANRDHSSDSGTLSRRIPPAQSAAARPAEDAASLRPDAEFEAGMRELQGPQRDSADAARHLWQSVKNQNSSALIPLAQLYANGDGVTKDCDQAKVLLDAATHQAKSRAQFLKAEMSRASLRTAGCE